MPAYRLFLLNCFSGHIEGAEEIVSADDVGAICLVQERAGQTPMELWCGNRKVRRFDAMPDVSRNVGRPRKRAPAPDIGMRKPTNLN